jgi:hypothetical protein
MGLVLQPWHREFQLWHYSVSYSQLLLRAIDESARPNRMDVLFTNVEFMQVRNRYSTLSVAEEHFPVEFPQDSCESFSLRC